MFLDPVSWLAGVEGTRRQGGRAWVGAGCQEDPAGPCGALKPAVSPEFWPPCVFLSRGRPCLRWLGPVPGGGVGAGPPSVSLEVLAETLGSMQVRGQGSSLGLPPPAEAPAPGPRADPGFAGVGSTELLLCAGPRAGPWGCGSGRAIVCPAQLRGALLQAAPRPCPLRRRPRCSEVWACVTHSLCDAEGMPVVTAAPRPLAQTPCAGGAR